MADKGFTNVILAVIVFVSFATGTVAFIQGMNAGYSNETIDFSDYENDFARLGEIEPIVDNTYDSALGDEEEGRSFEFWDQVGAVFNGLKRFINTLVLGADIATTSADNAGDHWQIPSWFIVMFGTTITFTFAVLLVSLIFRKKV